MLELLKVADIMNVVNKIWQEKPETASRVRGRIEAILDYSTALKFRKGENPARWKGNLDHILPKRNKAISILETMKEIGTCEYVFESQTKSGCMLSDMTLT